MQAKVLQQRTHSVNGRLEVGDTAEISCSVLRVTRGTQQQ
jgi:hypothetical protein